MEYEIDDDPQGERDHSDGDRTGGIRGGGSAMPDHVDHQPDERLVAAQKQADHTEELEQPG